jgi:hypothetical protein
MVHYYCEICKHVSGQRGHSDKHIGSHDHKSECSKIKLLWHQNGTTYGELIKKYNIEINIFEISGDIYDIIINKLSQKQITDDESNTLKILNNNRFIQELNPKYNTKFSLCTELTQFTMGKTEQSLQYISNIVEKYYINNIDCNQNIIEIIITNNSLLETEQWKVRTKSKFNRYEFINVDILSSKSDSDYKHISSYITKITKAKEKSDLPNILIMCAHKARVGRDLIDLFESFSGHGIIGSNSSSSLLFQLTFDEPDSYLGTLGHFLKDVKKYDHIIKEISFVTATFYENCWKVLNKFDIFRLNNLCKETLTEKSYDDYYNNYMSIKKHNLLECNYNTKNPLDYISNIFENPMACKPPFNPNERKIIFAPAHICRNKEGVGSHDEVAKYFLNKKYNVFVSNGLFKGFILSNGDEITLKSFKEKYNITGELRDVLRKFNELYPYDNLAITGYFTIERGITFNTDGFNFTDIIISDFHKKNINRLVQLIGRATGHKNYVKKMNIITTKEIYDKVNDMTDKFVDLRRHNIENYNISDFSNKNSAIPVKLEFIDNDFRLNLLKLFNKELDIKKNEISTKITTEINKGILSNQIIVHDRNNINKLLIDNQIKNKKLKTKRVYSKQYEENANSRRFKQFYDAFNSCKSVAQSGKYGEYCLDLCIDEYNFGDYVNSVNIWWITYKI